MECMAAQSNQKLDVAQSAYDMNVKKMVTKDQHCGTWWTVGADEFASIPALNQPIGYRVIDAVTHLCVKNVFLARKVHRPEHTGLHNLISFPNGAWFKVIAFFIVYSRSLAIIRVDHIAV